MGDNKELPRQQDTEWNNGWPKVTGWYDCLLDGELEMKLKFYVCQVACKPHWVDSHGDYMESMAKIQWKGKPTR